MHAECRVEVKTDGVQNTTDKQLVITDATTATIYISAATNFVNYRDVSADASKRAENYLKAAVSKPNETSLAAHVSLYKKQFDRVSFSLPATEQSLAETDTRVLNFHKGNDLNLAALLFQY